METLDTIITFIQTLGFPIACVVALGFFVWKVWNQQEDTYQNREEKFYEQLTRFNDALESFNVTLTKIDSRLEAVEKAVLEGEAK